LAKQYYHVGDTVYETVDTDASKTTRRSTVVEVSSEGEVRTNTGNWYTRTGIGLEYDRSPSTSSWKSIRHPKEEEKTS